jgi:hypothetical protein
VPASPVFKIVAANSHAHERLGSGGFPKDGKIFPVFSTGERKMMGA